MPVRASVLSLAAVLAAALLPASAQAANVQWFPVPTAESELRDIAAGADGNVWFTEHEGMQVGRITPDGTVTEFPGAPADATEGLGPTDIVTGQDGALWFLTDADKLLGRLDPATGKAIAAYDNGLYPMENLGAGVGGGAWLTFDHGSDGDHEDDGIVRYRADGTAVRFGADYLGDASPIAAAPDGAAWFGDGGKALKRISETGEASTVPVTGLGAVDEVTSIAFDRDGTPWFSAYNPKTGWFSSDSGGAIGRVAGGKAVATPLRDASVPRSLQLGPDGGMWFGVSGGVARTDASGVVKVAPLGAEVSELTFGPDGSIWVLDPKGNRVGKVAVDAALFPVGKGARPVFRVLGKLRAARKARALDVRCTLTDPGSCAVKVSVSKAVARSLKLGKARTLGSGTTAGTAAGEVRVKVKLAARAAKALGRVKRKVRVTLAVTVRGPQAIGSTTKTVTLRR